MSPKPPPALPPSIPSPTHNTFFPSDRTRISNAHGVEQRASQRRFDVVIEAARQMRGIAEWHDQTLRSLMRQKADQKAALGLTTLLSELSEGYGLGWSELARLVGVSVPAVRKWRFGGTASTEKLERLSQLAAFLDLLADAGVSDPAAWLSLPLSDDGFGVPKTAIYLAGGGVDLILYAKGHIGHADLVRRAGGLPPSRSEFRLVPGHDGNMSIVSSGR